MYTQAWVDFLKSSDATDADQEKAEGLTQDDIRFAPERIVDSLNGLEVDHVGALAVSASINASFTLHLNHHHVVGGPSGDFRTLHAMVKRADGIQCSGWSCA